jgi:hypothetical protein
MVSASQTQPPSSKVTDEQHVDRAATWTTPTDDSARKQGSLPSGGKDHEMDYGKDRRSWNTSSWNASGSTWGAATKWNSANGSPVEWPNTKCYVCGKLRHAHPGREFCDTQGLTDRTLEDSMPTFVACIAIFTLGFFVGTRWQGGRE